MAIPKIRFASVLLLLLLAGMPVPAQETNPDPCTRYACSWDAVDMPYCRYSAGRMGEWVECRTVQKCMYTYYPALGWYMDCYYDCEGTYCLSV